MRTLKAPPPTPVERLLRPFQQFAELEASSGLLLLLCTVVALVWANSGAWESYERLWRTPLTVGVGGAVLSKPLLIWINDALMAVFFLVVGLEIKREALVGELATWRKAALPVAAALGGMLFPAAIYAAINHGGPGAAGWGVPMATDIAFSLGALALLGSRAPSGLKIFLAAFAIADDLGAVLVIALFYSSSLSWLALAAAGGVWAAALAANLLGVRSPLVYGVLGAALWVAMLKSGVHATMAGVLLAFAIPARSRLDGEAFVRRARAHIDEFEQSTRDTDSSDDHDRQQSAVEALETACEHVQTPLLRMENALHGWVSYGIMPLFALANAGLRFETNPLATLAHRPALGILLGLIVGKQIGVTLFSWLAVRCGLADLPTGVEWRHVYGVSGLAGIGFTMSLFVADLAFPEGEALGQAKAGILFASLIAGLIGYILLRVISARDQSRTSRSESRA